jgi:hypothetical protein
MAAVLIGPTTKTKHQQQQRNIQKYSHNHGCCGKAIVITYSGFMSVFVVIQQEKRMRCYIVICDLTGVSHLSHIISQTARFSKEKKSYRT